ncbi:MAG: hypothetical protein GWN87_20285, partial [Desulfuromonadales bacterium]|nr:hypothetical protein [Desulfuromonadales bacterium]NIR75380.1 hypothetical protein [Candidatus Kutchimonas denitrificans]NIS42344.1 hypothetical protein [Desulfuromonadales bacterium]
MRKALFFILAILFVCSAPGWSLTGLPDTAATKAGPEFVPGQVLLKASSDISARQLAGSVDARILRGIGDGSIILLQVDKGEVAETIRALREQQGVIFAEPNWLRQPHAPDDDGYYLKWDLHNDGSLIDGSE